MSAARHSARTQAPHVCLLAWLVLASVVGGCRSIARVPRVDAQASHAFALARTHWRAGELDATRMELARARERAPDWIAPRRLEDELLRAELRGIDALAAHLAAIDDGSGGAAELYLAGRLEQGDTRARFERALKLDPRVAWAHHGLAFAAARGGDARLATRHAQRALECARDPFERAFFAGNVARWQAASGEHERALATLARAQAFDDVAPIDRLALWLAAIEIGLGDPSTASAAYAAGLACLRREDLTGEELNELVVRMRVSPFQDDAGARDLQLALGARAGVERARMRAELVLESSPTPLGLALLASGSAGREIGGTTLRHARFAAGDDATAIERWLAALPEEVLDAQGLPRSESLARVVRAVRAWNLARSIDPACAATLPEQLEVGDALLAAGWFREARAVAARLAACDLERASSLDTRALAGLQLLSGIQRVAQRIDLQQATRADRRIERAREVERAENADRAQSAGFVRTRELAQRSDSTRARESAPQLDDAAESAAVIESDDTESAASRTSASAERIVIEGRSARAIALDPHATGLGGVELVPQDLDEFLRALAPHFASAHVFLGGETRVDVLERELAASPRFSYAGLAHLVHPGPRFSRADERDGRGVEGERVPGLARLLERIGRFGLFGNLLGAGGPDATILPVLASEVRSGEHLGVPWRGTVVWCERADLVSRAGRRGAHISAAALHEGYWIDVDSLRLEVAAWDAFARGFETKSVARGAAAVADFDARVARALKVGGLSVSRTADDAARRERTRTDVLLGAGARLRLALLVERSPRAGELGRMTLQELLRLTSVHEEGHLCDHTRFLPIARNLVSVAQLLLQSAFSPERLAQDLEYRAQLTALCAFDEPRVPLVQVLDAAESGPGGVTPHAAGYTRLLADFVTTLDRLSEREPAAWSVLDRGRTLVHQLHRLDGEQVRVVARELARVKRML